LVLSWLLNDRRPEEEKSGYSRQLPAAVQPALNSPLQSSGISTANLSKLLPAKEAFAVAISSHPSSDWTVEFGIPVE